MSGWDKSSTPTWGSQDDPEEAKAGTPADEDAGESGVQDADARGRLPAGPPPEFFGDDLGQQDQPESTPLAFPRRTPGQSLQDLPRRAAPRETSYGQPAAYGRGPAGSYGQDTASGPDNGFSGRDNSSPLDRGFGRDNSSPPDRSFGSDSSFGRDAVSGPEAGFGQNWGADPDNSRDAAPQAADGGARRAAAPWEEQPQRDADLPARDFPGRDFPGPDYAAQEFGTQRAAGPVSRDLPPREFTAPGFADPGTASPDFPPREFGAPDYPGPGHSAQQPSGGPEQQAYGIPGFDGDVQMDPALRDFFGPKAGSTTVGGPGPGPGPDPGFGPGPDPGFGPGPGPGFGPGQPGKPGESGTWTEWWSSIPSRQQSTTSGTPLIPASRSEPRQGLGPRAYVAIAVLVAVVIAIAVVVFTHKSGGSSPTAASTPSGVAPSASAPASTGKTGTGKTGADKPDAGKTAGSGTSGTGTSAGAGSGPAYVLSAPDTAGGYAKDADPNFVDTTKSTGGQVAAAAGGAVKVKGRPVSAAYRLPISGQVVTFVGYGGTFAPAKVAKALASLGTDLHSYPAGPHGGTLSCFNTPAKGTLTSGAVCVWATASTMGITEFFSSTGPESLTASQDKGATDTVNLRADVEAKS